MSPLWIAASILVRPLQSQYDCFSWADIRAWFSFASERLLDSSSAALVWRRDAFKQLLWSSLEVLRQQGKCCDGERMQSTFYVAHGLPVEIQQFSQTFLGQARAQPRRANVSSNDPKKLTLCHPAMVGRSKNTRH